MRITFRSALLFTALVGLIRPNDSQGQERDVAAGEARLVVQTGHQRFQAVAFSSDGKHVLTGDADHTAQLWDAQTGKELLAFEGHTGPVHRVALSADGRRVLTCSGDGTAKLWDAQTGKELRSLTVFKSGKGILVRRSPVAFAPDGKRFLTGGLNKAELWDAESGKELSALKGRKGYVEAVAFSADGRRIVTGGTDKLARLWDAETGKELRTFGGDKNGGIFAVALSPDGKRLLTGDGTATARVWDVETGKELFALKGHTRINFGVNSGTFSADGRRILTTGDTTARLWDAETGKELLVLKGQSGLVNSAALSPDGKRVVTGGELAARLWDAETGKQLLAFQGYARAATAAVFSADGTRILLGSGDHTARLWDAETGSQLLTLTRDRGTVSSVALSPDGKRALTGSADKTAQVWDLQTGKPLFSLQGHKNGVVAVAYSPDGKQLLTAAGAARLWDAGTGKELHAFTGHQAEVDAVAFSPDSRQALSGGRDGTARLWDAATGKELRTFTGHKGAVHAAVFSPDGRRVLTGGGDTTARLWDAGTGKELLLFRPGQGGVVAVAFAPDGRRVLTGGGKRNPTARLWDAETGKEVAVLKGHTNALTAVAFSPDGKRILTASTDKTARLWDVGTGKELCKLIALSRGEWAVVEPAGRYDASHGGDVEGLHWVVNLEPVALSQLKDRYYEPGLLAKRLGLNAEPVREVAEVRDLKLYPEVAVAQADPKKPRFRVGLKSSAGGIGKVVVRVNGKEKTADARPPDARATAAELAVEVDLTNDPRLLPGRKNTVEVVAYNGDGSLSSRGMVREFDAPGQATAAPPSLHAVVVGVSAYQGAKLNLLYAAKDAEDFATALRLAAGRFFGADHVQLTLLTGATPPARPTRANLVKALEGLSGSKPVDIVVVYLAGHGVTHGGPDGDWYYLTADAQSGDLTDAAVRQQVSLSSAELTELLKVAPAAKQVLVLDTCHAGRLIEKLTAKREVPASQVRALERVKDRTGVHVLAGCAADAVSYEASRYGQGLLTYSLLLGMRGARLHDGEYVDVVELFGFAADKVPELARDIGGVQRPTIASPRGTSFYVGRLTVQDREKVPLQQVKPVLLRSVFQLEDPARDSLGLSKRINERLQTASAQARGARLVFVDAEDFPGGIQASGRYKIDGDKVTVRASLYQGEKEVATFAVEGTTGQPDELAGKIVAELEKQLAASPVKEVSVPPRPPPA